MPGPGDDQRHARQAVEEAAALVDQPVVAHRLAVVAHEHDDRVLALAGPIERLEDAPELVVDLLDHRVVGGLDLGRLDLVRPHRARLEVDPGLVLWLQSHGGLSEPAINKARP